MRMGQPKVELVMSRDGRVALEQWTQRRVSKQMAGNWRDRFVRLWVDGLLNEPRC